jgi:photosystem II stability/assembly factor-like uncharacterized protein
VAKTKARSRRNGRAPAPPPAPPPSPDGGDARRRLYGRIAWVAIVVLAAAGAFWVAKQQAEGPNEAVEPPPVGLPHTPDYHSLLVDASDPDRVLLGTHVGIYESLDGGRRWNFAGLEGDDAMNLVAISEGTVWVAGHGVLKQTTDAGANWEDVRPDGLPGLDIHGFAADPRFRDGSVLYAAVAGEGLYRSDDGGKSFEEVSTGVGPSVYGLGVTGEGRLFAADERGVSASNDNGTTWETLLEESAVGLAVSPIDPDIVLVTTATGISRTEDGGATWDNVQEIPEGAWPVAFGPNQAGRARAYVVGFDRKLYRSDNAGASWRAVG